jgi:diaminobutyrate-2-oxoglutarate transaminase
MKDMTMKDDVSVFEEYESNVRSYCKNFPKIFQTAKGSLVYSESGEEYVDFFAGAGALNYGHNNEFIKQRILSYLEADGIIHSLDMYTSAKRDFLQKFVQMVLEPRQLDYKVQFCGPTGTNAVEAALKLARRLKKRSSIFSFMGAYHGMSLASLSASGNRSHRFAAALPLTHVTFMPYPYGFMSTFDTITYIETVLNDRHSGIEKPAAILLETVQAEGGVIVAPTDWLQRLRSLCDAYDILLICDDIQIGCSRTGPFFSFERAAIVPDMVTLSKSISGYGLPMSLLLMRPELDIWGPGEHSGTFRGNQLAFVGASAALEYTRNNNLAATIEANASFIENFLRNHILPLNKNITIRGVGMIWGIDFSNLAETNLARRIAWRCFELGLLVETVGRDDTVIKVIPPLTIEKEVLERGLLIIKRAIHSLL